MCVCMYAFIWLQVFWGGDVFCFLGFGDLVVLDFWVVFELGR